MNEFLAFVADVMNVDVSELSLAVEYKVFPKWDSLMMLNLIMEIEEEYGVSIPLEQAGDIKTLEDLYKLTKA